MAFLPKQLDPDSIIIHHEDDETIHTSWAVPTGRNNQVVMYEKEKGKEPIMRVFEQREKYSGWLQTKTWIDQFEVADKLHNAFK